MRQKLTHNQRRVLSALAHNDDQVDGPISGPDLAFMSGAQPGAGSGVEPFSTGWLRKVWQRSLAYHPLARAVSQSHQRALRLIASSQNRIHKSPVLLSPIPRQFVLPKCGRNVLPVFSR